jgi:hypothetical protein
LGGPLVQATTITQGAFPLQISTNGSPLRITGLPFIPNPIASPATPNDDSVLVVVQGQIKKRLFTAGDQDWAKATTNNTVPALNENKYTNGQVLLMGSNPLGDATNTTPVTNLYTVLGSPVADPTLDIAGGGLYIRATPDALGVKSASYIFGDNGVATTVTVNNANDFSLKLVSGGNVSAYIDADADQSASTLSNNKFLVEAGGLGEIFNIENDGDANLPIASRTLTLGAAYNVSTSSGMDYILDDDNNSGDASGSAKIDFKRNGDANMQTIMRISDNGNVTIGANISSTVSLADILNATGAGAPGGGPTIPTTAPNAGLETNPQAVANARLTLVGDGTAALHPLRLVGVNSAIGTSAVQQVLLIDPGTGIVYKRTAVAGTFSDMRLKTNINTLQGALGKVMNLRPTEYYYNREKFPEMGLESGHQIGFIAQELEKQFPEFVLTNPDNGYKMVNYAPIVSVLTAAIQEQQAQIEKLKQQNKQLQSQVQNIQDVQSQQKLMQMQLDKLLQDKK